LTLEEFISSELEEFRQRRQKGRHRSTCENFLWASIMLLATFLSHHQAFLSMEFSLSRLFLSHASLVHCLRRGTVSFQIYTFSRYFQTRTPSATIATKFRDVRVSQISMRKRRQAYVITWRAALSIFLWKEAKENQHLPVKMKIKSALKGCVLNILIDFRGFGYIREMLIHDLAINHFITTANTGRGLLCQELLRTLSMHLSSQPPLRDLVLSLNPFYM